MQDKVVGTTMPVLEVQLEPGEAVVAEAGELGWMTGGVELRTSTRVGGGRGLMRVIKRALGGGTLFMTEYRAVRQSGMVAFPAKMPGQIMRLDLDARGYLVHRHGFLCGTPDVEISVALQRSLGAGLFGGDGFVLQRVAGRGAAWAELSGEVVSYALEPGQRLLVHPGHVGVFEEGVSFAVTLIRGIRNAMFGGDGLFLVELRGPGRVWLQSLPLPGLAHSLAPYLEQPGAGQG